MVRWSGPFFPLFMVNPEHIRTPKKPSMIRTAGLTFLAGVAAVTGGTRNDALSVSAAENGPQAAAAAGEGKEEAEGLQKTWSAEDPTLVAKYKGQPVNDQIQPKADVQPKKITISCRGMVIASADCPNGGTISGIWNHKHVAGDPAKKFAEHLVIGTRTDAQRQDGDDHWPHELAHSLSIKFMANADSIVVRKYDWNGGKRDLGDVVGEVGDIEMKPNTDIAWKVVDADGQLDVYVHDMNKPALTLTKEEHNLPDRPKGAGKNNFVAHDREVAGAINESTLTEVEVIPAGT